MDCTDAGISGKPSLRDYVRSTNAGAPCFRCWSPDLQCRPPDNLCSNGVGARIGQRIIRPGRNSTLGFTRLGARNPARVAIFIEDWRSLPVMENSWPVKSEI